MDRKLLIAASKFMQYRGLLKVVGIRTSDMRQALAISDDYEVRQSKMDHYVSAY